MTIHKATLLKSLLVFVDWRENWRKYYCFAGANHYYVPERYYSVVEELYCPHCGDELKWSEHLADADDYAL